MPCSRHCALFAVLLVAGLLPAAAGAEATPDRPFAPDSFWNTPLPADQPLDPSSNALVSELMRQVTWGTSIATTRWSTPVYTVVADQPTERVTLDAAWQPWDKARLQAAWEAVPIPSDAQPAVGTDAHLVVLQPATDTMWEFWRLSRQADGWHAGGGGRMEHVSLNPGYFSERQWGATATALPLLGGLIRISELQAGHIDHVLALAIPVRRWKAHPIFSWPAQKADGNWSSIKAIPEGARFRLDPSLDLESLALPRVTRIIADAAQRYGMVVRDGAGSVNLYAEDPTPTGVDPYPGLFDGVPPYQVLDKFPWDRLQALSLQIDTTPPDTAIASDVPARSPSPSAAFVFTSTEEEPFFRCALDSSPFAACNSRVDYAGLADGPHTVTVKSIDRGHNEDSTPATLTWEIDTVAPDTTVTSGPAGATASTEVRFDFTSTEDGGTYECRMDELDWEACAGPATFSDVAEGAHIFAVRATDEAGNVDATPAEQGFAIDALAPEGWPDNVAPETRLTEAPSLVGEARLATFSFLATESSDYECRLDEDDWAACSSPVEEALSEGGHIFEVRATDAAGNVDLSPARAELTVDLSAPETTFFSKPPALLASEHAEFEVDASEPVAYFECRVDAADWTRGCPVAYTQLPDGPHTIQARATDLAGNPDPSPASVDFTVDTSPSTTTLHGPSAVTTETDATFTIESSEPGSTIRCQLDAEDPQECPATVTLAGLARGMHTFAAWSVDEAGNAEPTRRLWKWTSCTLLGTAGADTLTGTAGDDVLCGGAGEDTLNGAGGNDLLVGGAAKDKLKGGPGDDQLVGEAGNDTLDGQTGADVLTGGDGNDNATYAARPRPVTVTMGVGADDGEAGERDDVGADVEILFGGTGADRLTGGRGGETINGGAGADVLAGGAGPDWLDGGAGADTIDGSAGTDTVTYGPRLASEPVSVDLVATTPVQGGASDGPPGARDTLVSIEVAVGGKGDDVLVGGPGADRLTGGLGVDILIGKGGSDQLNANDGFADALLDCEGGLPFGAKDKVTVDPLLDPLPLGCETVTVKAG